MANAQNTLDVLVKLGVIGEADLKAANQLLAETGAATEKAGEHAKEANHHHGESRLIFAELNKLVPGLGHALHAAFAGPLGAIILAGIAVHEVQEKLAEYNKELDAVGERELAEHEEEVGKVRKAWDEAKSALGKYYADMATAGEEKDPIKKQLDNIKQLNDAQLEATKKEIEALGKQELSYLRAHGASPEIIAAVEERQRRELESLDSKKKANDGVDYLQGEKARREAAAPELNQAALETKERADKAAEAFNRNQSELDSLRLQMDPRSDRSKEDQRKRAEIENRIANLGNLSDFSATGEDLRGYKKEKIGKAQKELDELSPDKILRRIQQLEHEITGLSANKEFTANEARLAEERSKTNQGRLRELPGDIAQAQKVQGVNDAGREALDIINTTSARTHLTFGQMAAAIGMSHDKTLKVAERIVNHQLTVQQELTALEGRLSQLESQRHTAP